MRVFGAIPSVNPLLLRGGVPLNETTKCNILSKIKNGNGEYVERDNKPEQSAENNRRPHTGL